MAIVGVISRKPPISKDEWTQAAHRDGNLVATPSRVIKNPFTGQMTTVRSSAMRIYVDGELLGAIEASAEFDKNGELVVWGKEVTEPLRQAISKLATALDAQIDWFPTPL